MRQTVTKRREATRWGVLFRYRHVQFGFAHSAFEAQEEAIMEHGRMINAVYIDGPF